MYSDEHVDDFYPSCYILSDEDDRDAFLKHYLRCSAASVLDSRGEWQPPLRVIEIALAVLEDHIAERHQDDLDCPLGEERRCSPAECHALVQVNRFSYFIPNC